MSVRWNFLGCSFLALLLSAYLDNIRGPLLPYFSRALDRPYSEISWFLSLGNLAAVAMNLSLIPLVARLGTPRVARGIWALSIITVLIGFQVVYFESLMAWAILLGATISGLGAICNLLLIRGTDSARRARAFAGLHVMYGLGSFLAPLSLAAVFARSIFWHGVLWWAVGGLVVWIALLLRADDTPFKLPENHDRFRPDAGVLWIIAAFTCYVVGEVTVSTWLSAFLVESRGMTVPQATPYLTGFFLCMMASRLLFSLGVGGGREVWVMWGSLVAALLFFFLGLRGWMWGFALTGVFGPFYPILLGRMSRRYGYHSERITLWILTSTQLGLFFSQFFMGRCTDWLGINQSYLFAPVMLTLAGFAVFFYGRAEATPEILTTTRLRR